MQQNSLIKEIQVSNLKLDDYAFDQQIKLQHSPYQRNKSIIEQEEEVFAEYSALQRRAILRQQDEDEKKKIKDKERASHQREQFSKEWIIPEFQPEKNISTVLSSIQEVLKHQITRVSVPEEEQTIRMRQDIKLLIQNDDDSNNKLSFIIDKCDKTLGRSKLNVDINITEQNKEISLKHAMIKFRKSTNEYYLKDLGSTNGTYFFLDRTHEIEFGNIFGIGYYSIEVTQIAIDLINSVALVELQVMHNDEKFDENYNIKLSLHQDEIITFGKSTCTLMFNDNSLINNLQCKLIFDGTKLIIEPNIVPNGHHMFLKLKIDSLDQNNHPHSLEKKIEFKGNEGIIRFAMKRFNVQFI